MKPSSAATYERARRLANQALWTVDLQRRRLNSDEPEDAKFILRKWSDFHFLVVALTRLRRAAALAAKVPEISHQMCVGLTAFDSALPNLKKMRDVAEHIDDYAVDGGKDGSISRMSLEVGSSDGEVWQWLGFEIDAGVALSASVSLFEALKVCASSIKPELSVAPQALKRNARDEINGDKFVSPYSLSRTDKKKELQRLLLAHSDIYAAHNTSNHFLHIIPDDGIHKGTKYAGMDHPLYTPLVSAMVVSYAKPFVRSDTVGQLKKEWEKFSNSKWALMHTRILKARHEIFAHNDAKIRQIKICPPREIKLFNRTGETYGIGFGIAGYDFSLLEIRTFAELSYDLAHRLFTECNQRIEELYVGMELPRHDFPLRYNDGL